MVVSSGFRAVSIVTVSGTSDLRLCAWSCYVALQTPPAREGLEGLGSKMLEVDGVEAYKVQQ